MTKTDKILQEIVREYPKKTMNHAELWRFWDDRAYRLIGLWHTCPRDERHKLVKPIEKSRKMIVLYIEMIESEIQQFVNEKYGKLNCYKGLWKAPDIYFRVYLKEDEPIYKPRVL